MDSQAEEDIPNGWDLQMLAMRNAKIPITRENYISYIYPDGIPNPWDAELEASLPETLQDWSEIPS